MIVDITEYVKDRGIKLRVLADEGPGSDEHGWQHYGFKVQLRLGTKTVTTPWRQGTYHGNTPPKADEVLNGLLLDASFGEYDFAEFCAESGFDTETFADAAWDDEAKAAKDRAEKTYKACVRMAKRLPEFLGGPDEYDRAQQCERL